MSEETMTADSPSVLACPKDGAEMAAVGRGGRSGAYRCPECKSMFLDMKAMRHGAAGRAPTWSPFVMSVLMSVGMTMLIRRLRHRPKA